MYFVYNNHGRAEKIFYIIIIYNKNYIFIIERLIKKILSISIKSIGILLLLYAMSASAYAFQYKDLDLKIQTSVSEMYDDNILFSKENKQEDYITTLTLGLSTAFEGKRQSLDFSGSVNNRFNAKFSDIKNSSEDMSVRYSNQLTVYDAVNLLYRFNHSYTPASFEEALERVVARRESFLHRISFNYRKHISEHFSTVLRYAYRLEKFSEEFREDQYNNHVGINLNYKPSIETTYFFSYTYSQNKFNNVVNSLSIGTIRYLTKNLYLDGEVGVNFTSSTSSFTLTKNDRSSPSARISLTADLDPITVATLSLQRSDQFSSERGDISTSWQINGQYSRQLLDRLIGSLSVFYGENKSDDSGDKNLFLGGQGAFVYEFVESFTGQLQYVYGRLDSSDKGTGYSRNAVLIGLQKVF